MTGLAARRGQDFASGGGLPPAPSSTASLVPMRAPPYALGVDRNGIVWYSSEHMDVIGALDPKTGRVTEYPYPHSENTMREFFTDREGRMWFGSPANNKVGYFYLAAAAK